MTRTNYGATGKARGAAAAAAAAGGGAASPRSAEIAAITERYLVLREVV